MDLLLVLCLKRWSLKGDLMSSCPVTNNPFCWHHEQNTLEQQSSNIIPIPNDAGASQLSSVGQSVWNAERLNHGLSGSSFMTTGSGHSDQLMETGSTSSSNACAGACSGSNDLSYQPITGTSLGNSNGSSTHNSIKPLIVKKSRNEISPRDFLSLATSSGHPSTEHFATASSSANPSMDFCRIGSLSREKNNDGLEPTVVSGNSSDKRKSPNGGWDKSSASASKRVVPISGSSSLLTAPPSHASGNASSVSLSSANIFGLGSSYTLRPGAIPPACSSSYGNPQLGMARGVQNIQHNL